MARGKKPRPLLLKVDPKMIQTIVIIRGMLRKKR